MFHKILIANRGEIAVRVMRTARELGIRTVAVYSDVDAGTRHVELADEAVCIGPPQPAESYLNIAKIIQAAKDTGAEAIHPGYGFLSENPRFAEAVGEAGLVFIGPPPRAMGLLGNKIESRVLAQQAGVPVTPGTIFDTLDPAVIAQAAERIGYPVLIKAAAGGGGKGMRVVHDPAELQQAVEGAMREAGSAFGDSTVYLEKYLARPRHIEFQIFCDAHGHAVHLGERECSVQRRHQKIIEESPSAVLTPELRRRMGEAAVKVVSAAGYVNAGTVEFLYADRDFYFLEVNARLQVEHPVTEMVTGEDLVEWQLRVAAGEPLPKTQDEIRVRGHAVECRIYAEDAARGFLPSSGTIRLLEEPLIPGVRIDSGIRTGSEVSVYYDPILSKVIAYGENRTAAIRKLRAALAQYVLLGVATPLEMLRDILGHHEFAAGNLSTHFLDDYFPEWSPAAPTATDLAAALLAATRAPAMNQATAAVDGKAGIASPWHSLGGWRIAGRGPMSAAKELLFNGKPLRFKIDIATTGSSVTLEDQRHELNVRELAPGRLLIRNERGQFDARVVRDRDRTWVWLAGRVYEFQTPSAHHEGAGTTEASDDIRAPMPGTLVKLLVAAGDAVDERQIVAVVEAMKMEHALRAPRAGVVANTFGAPGAIVDADAVIVSLVPKE